MRKFFSLFLLTTLFMTFSCQAVRTNPRVGRPVWTMIRQATPQPIEAADAVGGTITIDQAGNYELYEDIENINIIISSELVSLDLNGYQITYNDKDQDIITINASRVKIYNGFIKNTAATIPKTGVGVLISAGLSEVTVELVQISDCANGIFLNGQDGNEVLNCQLIQLDLVSNSTGVALNRADENIFRECSAIYSSQAGFALSHSESNCFFDCEALKTEGSASVSGFQSDSGRSNLFQGCLTKKTVTTATDFCNKSHGFLLTGTEENTKIIESVVNETGVDLSSSTSAISYGIFLHPTLYDPNGSDLLSQVAIGRVDAHSVSLAWAPDGSYIAQTNEYGLIVYGFDGENISAVAWTECDLTWWGLPRTVDWSADGRHLLLTETGDTTSRFQILEFKGTSTDVEYCPNLSYVTSYTLDPNDTLEQYLKILSGKWHPSGQYFAIALLFDVGLIPDSRLWLFRFDGTGIELLQNQLAFLTDREIHALAWSPDGRFLATGDDTGEIIVFNFDGKSLTELYRLDTGEEEVWDLEWSPNGKVLAAVSALDDVPPAGSIHILNFDLLDTNSLAILDTVSSGTPRTSISWSPDGKYIATGDASLDILSDPKDGTPHNMYIARFYGENLAEVKRKEGLDDKYFNTIAWSPCGQYIAFGTNIKGYTTSESYTGTNSNGVEILKAMYGPISCLIEYNKVCDTFAENNWVGTGLFAAGHNSCFKNICCGNEVDFSFGVPNVYYNDHNKNRPFDNVATLYPQYIQIGERGPWYVSMA